MLREALVTAVISKSVYMFYLEIWFFGGKLERPGGGGGGGGEKAGRRRGRERLSIENCT